MLRILKRRGSQRSPPTVSGPRPCFGFSFGVGGGGNGRNLEPEWVLDDLSLVRVMSFSVFEPATSCSSASCNHFPVC